jgi:kynurenine 3-monooxygenase
LFYPHELFDKIKTDEDAKKLFKVHFPDAYELIGEERVVKEFANNPTGSLVTMRVSSLFSDSHFLVLSIPSR